MCKLQLKKYLLPCFYVVVMLLIVFYAWNEQKISHNNGNNPIYRNLMDNEAFIKRGFDIEETRNLPADFHELDNWYYFEERPLNLPHAPIPDLPKSAFFYPWGNEPEEFTILIPVEFDDEAVAYLNTQPVVPGMSFAVIGENWEIYFNGTLVQSGMSEHDRTWRNLYFPFEGSLIKPGTNILALRIIGDPAYTVSGLALKSPNYIDDFKIILRRQINIPLIILSSIFLYSAIHYFILFFIIKNKKEIYRLYFGIFSILLCIYSFTRHSVINFLIPDGVVSGNLEYIAMIMLIPVFFMFLETLVSAKISRAGWIYFYYCLFLSIIQMLFSNRFAEDVVDLWNITVILYGTYFLFYKLVFFYIKNRKKLRGDNANIVIAIVSMSGLWGSGIYEILEIMFFRNYISVFQYSLFIIYIGMDFILADRFGAMYKKLGQTNIVLKTRISELENLKIGLLNFDLVSYQAFYDGKDLLLAPKEFSLLYMLARNEGKTLSAKQLYESVWKQQYLDTSNATFRAHIMNLKKKLDSNACEVIIDTIRGEGYKLSAVKTPVA